jgi:hypothetical protein
MNRLVPLTAALLIAAFVGLFSSGPADARGGHRHHGHSHGHVHFGFAFGAPLFYPGPVYYPYPRYYEPYPVYVPPPQYIEQSPPEAAPAPPSPPAPAGPSQGGSAQSGQYWYFCPDSQTYYPYVQTCASQWQQVVPRSGPPS